MTTRILAYSNQRGIASVWAVLFILIGAMLTLTQVYQNAGSRSTGTMQQADSTRAFLAAESGLQSGESVITYANDPYSSCSGTTSGQVGTGSSFSYTAALSPSGCGVSSVSCGCLITSTGKVPATGTASASRTVQRLVNIVPGTTGGTFCDSTYSNCQNLGTSPTWYINGTNLTGNPAVAIVHLAAGRQGNPSGTTCPPAGNADSANCVTSMRWYTEAKTGSNAVISEGHSWDLANGASTGKLWMQVNAAQSAQNDPVAIHGVLYPGNTGTTPTFKGAYWYSSNGKTMDTASGGSTTFNGETNNGTATSSGTCDTPVVSPYVQTAAADNQQNCTRWCWGGERLIFAAATWATSNPPSGTTQNLSQMSFNGVTFTQDIHYPNPSIAGAEEQVYSEFWSSPYNPDYLFGATLSNTSSVTNTANPNNYISVTVNGPTTTIPLPNSPAALGIQVGDMITKSTGGANNGGTIPNGTYVTVLGPGNQITISATLTGAISRINANRLQLTVASVIDGSIQLGQAVSSTGNNQITTIYSGTTSPYVLTTTNLSNFNTVSGQVITTGAYSVGATIYLGNATATLPLNQLPSPSDGKGAYLAVRYGTGSTATGKFGTTPVRVRNTNYDTVNKRFEVETLAGSSVTPGTTAGTTALNGAQICGGACAFFDHTQTWTPFQITKYRKQDYVASGLFCLQGSNLAGQVITIGSTISRGRWQEITQ